MAFVAFVIFLVAALVFGAGVMWLFNGTDRARRGDSKFGVTLLVLFLILVIVGSVVWSFS